MTSPTTTPVTEGSMSRQCQLFSIMSESPYSLPTVTLSPAVIPEYTATPRLNIANPTAATISVTAAVIIPCSISSLFVNL